MPRSGTHHLALPAGLDAEQAEAKQARSKLLLRQIRHYQKQTDDLITTENFREVVQQQLTTQRAGLEISEPALDALQAAAEHLAVKLLENSQLIAVHAKRIKVTRMDMRVALAVMEDPALRPWSGS